MSSVAGPQVITTGGVVDTSTNPLQNNQVALWVAAYMLIGLAGLIAIAVIFRKRVEI
jgi:hypothetical protein